MEKPPELDAPENPETTGMSQAQWLIKYLSENNALCPACGYNMRQLSRPVCPECGLSLQLSVGSNEPFKRTWAITLMLNAMIAGVGGIFVLITIAEGSPPIYNSLDVIWYYGPIVWSPAPFVLLFLRKAFCRMPKPLQYLVMGLTIAAMLVFGGLLVNNL